MTREERAIWLVVILALVAAALIYWAAKGSVLP